jgi:endonuclease I
MTSHRRLTAALVAVSLGWSMLTVGLVAPSAQAATASSASATTTAASSTTTSTVTRRDAPHDPATYYAGTDGLSGATLAARLHAIVQGHTKLSYGAVYDALPVTDPDPAHPGYLIDFYSGTSILASNRCGSSCAGGAWNREHTWPQSHGDFGTTAGIGTDLHHMRPEFGTTNSSRGNLDFDETAGGTVPNCTDCTRDSDSFEGRDATKGDLARGLFYMAVRYEGDSGELNLKMNDRTCNGAGTPNMGKLSTLIAWSLADPPDDVERTRNDLVDGTYQHNRNPFVDHPEWVTSVFGNGVGQGPACGSTSGSDYAPGGSGPANTAPTTSARTASTAEDAATTVSLTATDADGDPLTWSVRQTPTHGTASIAAGTPATLTYTPAADFNGTDVVGVRVSDGRGGTADTTVTITVTPVNDAPVAAATSATTPAGTSTPVTLLGSDVDGDALTYAVATQPTHGSVTLDGATATYTPAAGYAGPDSFTYTVRDPSGATSAAATASIAVVAAAQHDPVATSTTATTPEDQPVTVTLTASDPDGDPLSYSIAARPAHGSVRLAGDKATYTPERDFHGTDSFTFTASDPSTVSSPATVSLTVTPVNDAPVARPASATTRQSAPVTLTLSGSDVDGDALTYALAAQPAHGTVSLTGALATYTPAAGFSGSDTFTWTVSDGAATTTGTATVTVTANQRPTAASVSATTTEDGAVTIPLAGSDADADPLTYATVTTPAHGTVEVAGTTATYTPDAGFSGTDTFTYTASDGLATSEPATVTVTVSPVNHAPTVAPVQLSTTAGTPVTATLQATDADGDPVTITGVTTPEHGTASFTAPRTVTYTPATRSGTETFLVTVADGRGGEAQAQVSVTITPRTATLTLSTPTPTRGSRVTTTITATGPSGPRPTGTVVLRTTGRTLGTATLRSDGTTTVSWIPSKAGATSLVVDYSGDTALFAPRTTPVTKVTVARTRPTLGFTSGTLKRGRAGVLKVSVRTVAGVRATGKVTLTVGGKQLSAWLSSSVATFKVAKLPQAGRVSVSARYAGDTQYAAGSAAHTYAIGR